MHLIFDVIVVSGMVRGRGLTYVRRRATWRPFGRPYLSLMRLTSLILHIHVRPCYGQLTPVKTMHPLTSITDHTAGSSVELIEVKYFLKLTADQVIVFRWSAG